MVVLLGGVTVGFVDVVGGVSLAKEEPERREGLLLLLLARTTALEDVVALELEDLVGDVVLTVAVDE